MITYHDPVAVQHLNDPRGVDVLIHLRRAAFGFGPVPTAANRSLTYFNVHLVPTTSIITGPWSLWAPAFGGDAIDVRRLRQQTLAAGNVVAALDRVPARRDRRRLPRRPPSPCQGCPRRNRVRTTRGPSALTAVTTLVRSGWVHATAVTLLWRRARGSTIDKLGHGGWRCRGRRTQRRSAAPGCARPRGAARYPTRRWPSRCASPWATEAR